MRRIDSSLFGLFTTPLLLVMTFATAAQAQTSPRITFGMNPAIFRAGQPASAELSVSSVSMSPLTLSSGNTFMFFVDGSLGTVTSVTTPIALESSTILAGDFSVSFAGGSSPVVITYIGAPKSFAFGECFSVKVNLIASAQAGPGKLSLSSQFVSPVNGNLPFTTVSIVDFANSGNTSVAHDLTLKGDGAGNPLGVAVPLTLTGSVVPAPGAPVSIITATNLASLGNAIKSTGGNGDSIFNNGGDAIDTRGGNATADGTGGTGILAFGGSSPNGTGGGGLTGGSSANASGGHGLVVGGGAGHGAGNKGGSAIMAIHGSGLAGATVGFAGEFFGDVSVSGNLSKGGGSFKIDHPVDPANKYLYHSFVESPDMMNIYNGVTILDAAGEAVVELPEWFGALNRDFRYLLTAIGAPGPTLYIAEEVNGNHFKIAGGSPRMKVSWLVTGIRQDAWANAHRIPVEEEKPASERGYYLHPELFGQPERNSVQWARHPEAMQRIKEARNRSIPPQDVDNQ